MGLRQDASGKWVYTFGPQDYGHVGPQTPYPNPLKDDPVNLTALQRRRGTLPRGPGDPGMLTSQPSLNSAQLPYVGTNSFVGGGGTKFNAPKRPFVSRPGQTRVHGTEAPPPNPVVPYKASPSLGSTPPRGQAWQPPPPKQDPLDRLKELAMQLAGGVGAYPGAVQTLLPEMPHFARWQRDQDLSGIFDPIEAEYAPVIDTLYNNLQGSMGNIQQNLQNQWQGVEDQLSGQWAGLEQDQQQAFAERDAELRRLATELGVPESAMMTDPNLERWGRENERLKQLNATLKTGSMGTLDTLAESNAASIGAYQPALEAASGQAQADMLLGLSQQKGALGSDLLNLESQYNTQASLNEQELYQQLVDLAREQSGQEYDRRVQGWSMRNQAAQDAMANWQDFYLQKQKQEAEAAAAAQQSNMFKQLMESQNVTTAENSSAWQPFWSELEQDPDLQQAWIDYTAGKGGITPGIQEIFKVAGGPNQPRFEDEGTGAYIRRLAPNTASSSIGRFFQRPFQPVRAALASTRPSRDVDLARRLEALFKSSGAYPAWLAGQAGIPSTTSRTTNRNTVNG